MPKLIITCGVSGSGKSTYAQTLVDQGWVEINRDNWRFAMFCEGVHDWNLYKFSKAKEDEVTEVCLQQFHASVAVGVDIVVSNTNLNKKDHEYWKTKAEEVGYDFEVMYFPITLTEALKRDKKRGLLSVGHDVIISQWQKWLKITEARIYKPDYHKPRAIILDIDGTIALNTSRDIFDFSEAVMTDRARLDVMDLVGCYAEWQGAEVICVSGRDEVCKEHTQDWLNVFYIDNTQLFMRKEGDQRCDTIVKEEIFWEHIADNYNVIAVFDDRPKVIRKWKDIGIPLVISVQQDYREF